MSDDAEAPDSIRLLLDCLREETLPHGREDSFKLSAGELLDQRVMLGVRMRDLGSGTLQRIVDRLRMPTALQQAMHERLGDADVVLFAAEQRGAESTLKVYLEFWDTVRARVTRTGSREPLLLNLGFKWRLGEATGRTARYTCFPLLSTSECLERMTALCGDAAHLPGAGLARELVAACATRAPQAAFVYMEVEEEATPRRSFDIKLYQAGMPMRALAPWLETARGHYGLPTAEVQALLARIGGQTLGHLSGGIDRHGRDFLTVYFEIEPL